MYPRYRQVESDLDATERSSLSESIIPAARNTPRILDKQSATNSARSTEPTQTSTLARSSQERQQGQQMFAKEKDRVSESSSLPAGSGTRASSDEELLDSAESESAMIIKIPCVNWNQSHVSFAVEFDVADLESAASNQTRRDETRSESDGTFDSPNSDSVPFATRTFYVLPSSVTPFATHYDRDYYKGYDYAWSRFNSDHVICKSTYTRDNPMDTVALSDVGSRAQQFSDRYNYAETGYAPLPNALRHQYVIPVRTYARVPLYRAFSSSAYY